MADAIRRIHGNESISDLFRDHKLNGWWKAVWIIFLIFAPFLTALVYVIARGKGMAERTASARGGVVAEADDYRPAASSTPTPMCTELEPSTSAVRGYAPAGSTCTKRSSP